MNENGFIENLVASTTTKKLYVGTERQTDVIINVHVACSEEVSCPVVQKCKPGCVIKLLSANKEK